MSSLQQNWCLFSNNQYGLHHFDGLYAYFNMIIKQMHQKNYMVTLACLMVLFALPVDATNNCRYSWGCFVCVEYTGCTSCIRGYYLSNNYCYSCREGCLNCLDRWSCFQCKSGYFISFFQGLCEPCPYGCSNCYQSVSMSYVCLTCKERYYKHNSVCNSCSFGCTQCSGQNYCLTCQLGYYLTYGSRWCCEKNVRCNFPNGSYLQQELFTNCKDVCSMCINSTSCSNCYKYYFINSSSCQKCGVGCQNCINNTYCTSCRFDYYLNQSQCLYCGSQCRSCANNIGCTQCLDGLYISNSTCLPCPDWCLICQTYSCRKCSTSAYLINGICNLCPYYATCIDEIGKTCWQGYYDNDQGGCLPCPDLCLTCQTYSCTKCTISAYLINGTCIQCPSKCPTCRDEVGCVCNSGYYNSNNRSCQKCIPNCGSCFNDYTCRNCSEGYILSSDQFYCQQQKSSQPEDQESSQPEDKKLAIIIGPVVGGVVFLVLLIVIIRLKICKQQQIVIQPRGDPPSHRDLVFASLWKSEESYGHNPHDPCPICQLQSANSKTQCRHFYHFLCLKEWAGRGHNCPICRSAQIINLKFYCSRCFKYYLEVNLNQFRDHQQICDFCKL